MGTIVDTSKKFVISIIMISNNRMFKTYRRFYLRLSQSLPNSSHEIKQKTPKAERKGIDEDTITSNCKSYKLMIDAGVLRTTSNTGTYTLLPPGIRALQKLHALIDYEMVDIGAQKLSMPCLSADTPWRTSARFTAFGGEMYKVKDRRSKTLVLCPTHEEAITELVATYATSLSRRMFPLKLYQIGRKFRDEIRPKNGLLRCKEFEMKDLYTFDLSIKKAQVTYDLVCSAYNSLLRRLGLNYAKVSGDVGAMGGASSHEYHLLSSCGEDNILICTECQKSTNTEMFKYVEPKPTECQDCGGKLEIHSGIEVAHAFLLGTRYSAIFNAYSPLNEEEEVDKGSERNTGKHILFVQNITEDTTEEDIAELFVGNKGVLIPRKPSGRLEGNALVDFETSDDVKRCIAKQQNVCFKGNQLELRYEGMKAAKRLPTEGIYRTHEGKLTMKAPLQMGCFGIGVTRLLAASIEVLSSEGQLRWPPPIAPYQVMIIPQKEGYGFERTLSCAEQLASDLSSVPSLHGDVVMDDRHKLSIGRRLKAANCSGYPWAVVVGKQALEEPARYELVDIYNNESELVSLETVKERLIEYANSIR